MLRLVTALALLPAAPPPADDYVFLPDTVRLVQMFRPDGNYGSYVRGWLDDAGNFVPPVGRAKPTPGPARSLWVKAGPSFSGLPATVLTRIDRAAAYEYRSGILIQGRFNDAWKFVPDVGGTVIDLRDYLKDDREGVTPPIWNLPGTLHKKGTPVPLTDQQKSRITTEQLYRQAMADRGIVNPPPLPPTVSYPNYRPTFLDDPPAARPAVAPAPPAPVPPGAFEFVPDTDRRVELRRRYGDQEYWSIGTLDAAGTFEFDDNYLHCTGPKPAGTPAAVLLNRADLGPCYEYRSGRLIKGRLDERLNFVPEVGSTVIDLKDYKYGPKDSRYASDPLPIWNLPGAFQKKDADKR